jgi:hypothetical protein
VINLSFRKAEEWLDSKIQHLNSFLFYTEQPKLSMPEGVYISKINIDQNPKESPKKLLKESRKLSKNTNQHTVGIIAQKSEERNLNILIAAMNKQQIKDKDANFFVITDSEKILHKLCDVFRWMNTTSYILPNSSNSTVNAITISKLNKIITLESSDLCDNIASNYDAEISTINKEEIFVFDCKQIAPQNNKDLICAGGKK